MIGEVEPYNHLTSFFLQIRVIVEGYFIKLSSIFQDTALFMTFVGDVLILSCSMYIKSPCFFLREQVYNSKSYTRRSY
jgi:hypothetical protein